MNAWADQAGRLPRPGSADGPGLTEAQLAFVCLSEYGYWPFRETLFELPPETGEEIMALMGSCVPYRTKLLEMILERLSM